MDNVIQTLKGILDSAGGLIAAITALIVALVALIDSIRELRSKVPGPNPRLLLRKLPKKPLFYVSLTALLIAVGIFYVRSLPPPLSLTDDAMKLAFDEFNNSNYDAAIARANECIDNFKPSADNLQAQLEATQTPNYPIGKVDLPQRQEISNNGALNAVAACYWTKGRSYQAKGDLKQAKEAYLVTAQYTYARVYDPTCDCFWSPPDDAEQRAKQIP